MVSEDPHHSLPFSEAMTVVEFVVVEQIKSAGQRVPACAGRGWVPTLSQQALRSLTVVITVSVS
jgi:hypothetical protein